MNIDEAKQLANELLKQHNLYEYTIEYTQSKSILGACNDTKKTIKLSVPYILLNTKETVKNIILHEIAHAIAGNENNHNWKWQKVAKQIGSTGSRLASQETISPTRQYEYTCPICQQKIYRYRKFTKLACGKCCRCQLYSSYRRNQRRRY